MLATLIFPNRNGRHLLATCLPAAIEAVKVAGGGHRILVVDDGSADGSADFVKQSFPRLQVAEIQPSGFARACNTGAQEAQTEALVFLNSDVIVAPDFLYPLLSHLNQHQVFAVGAKFLNPDGSLEHALGNGTSGRWQRGLLHLVHETDPDRLREPAYQLYCMGGAMAVTREKFLALGGFDTLYSPFYWEDMDLSYRAWARGWEVIYEPRSVVYHHQGSTTGRHYRRAAIERASTKNAYLFIWKNIMDSQRLAWHCAHLPLLVSQDILITSAHHYRAALRSAFGQLREVMAKRAQERSRRRRSDVEILALSAGDYSPNIPAGA